MKTVPATLALADGTIFSGRAFGARGETVGEVVFCTAMTGYQEILTDPSYSGQIVTMTAPEIGNVGVNPEDVESARPFAAGLVVRERSPRVSHWRARGSLDAYLEENAIPGLWDIDTRALVRHIRTTGAQMGVLSTECDDPPSWCAGHARRRRWRDATSRAVTCREPYSWDQPSFRFRGEAPPPRGSPRRRLRLRHQAEHPATPARHRRA